MGKFPGPLMILIGMVLLELLQLKLPGLNVGEKMQQRMASWGVGGAALLGIIFAMSFCPLTAALFFGTFVPLAVTNNSYVSIPAVFGIGAQDCPFCSLRC